MEHGKNHDERLQHAERPRANNLPIDDDSEVEADLLTSGRGDARPREGAVGAHAGRAARGGTGPRGSNCAPTRQAEERERTRHRIEHEMGRVAAGEYGNRRDAREQSVTREDLDEAAREADRRVVGHELPPTRH